MSEDQKRDRDAAIKADEGSLFSQSPHDGGDPNASDEQRPERRQAPSGELEPKPASEPESVVTSPKLDDEAMAKHRAAKEARIRKREEEKRAATEAALEAKKADKKGPRTGKGSALPALRPNLKADTPALRAERVEAIRRDLVRRRRRKGVGMLVKLWLFVMLPTMIVTWFMYFESSELYKSESKFVVRSAETGGGGGGAGGGLLGAILGGGGSPYDPNAVQTYMMSRDVLKLLDNEHGWIAHFQQPDLDYFNGLPADATFEDAFNHYQKMLEISFDPSEGLIEMSLVAADPDAAERFSKALIGYAEEMVNRLSERIQLDAVKDADRNLVDAEQRLREAQEAVAELQEALAIFTVEGEVSAEMSIISGMEVELEALRGRLTNLRRVTDDADPRVQRISAQVATLERQIAERRANMTGSGDSGTRASLAEINLQLTKARFEVEAATAIFSAAVERREVAYATARRQGRYLEMVAYPSTPDEANHPKKLETVALAFFVLLGFYIVGSLTISLIREQASI
ncbi:MAG: hypothetical protein AAGK00_11905 [Pseudomonadota bacterium]